MIRYISAFVIIIDIKNYILYTVNIKVILYLTFKLVINPLVLVQSEYGTGSKVYVSNCVFKSYN